MSDMALLTPRRFTVDEYHRIAKAGVFGDDRVELLDGLVVKLSPIGPRHWRRHAQIVAYLNGAVRGHALVVGQGSFPLGTLSEPQPDIALLAPHSGEDNHAPSPDELFAFIEVSDSSLAKDVGPKLRLYARSGIADYLVVDVDANVLRHYAEPKDDGYQRSVHLTYDDTLKLARLPDVVLDAGAFLNP